MSDASESMMTILDRLIDEKMEPHWADLARAIDNSRNHEDLIPTKRKFVASVIKEALPLMDQAADQVIKWSQETASKSQTMSHPNQSVMGILEHLIDEEMDPQRADLAKAIVNNRDHKDFTLSNNHYVADVLREAMPLMRRAGEQGFKLLQETESKSQS